MSNLLNFASNSFIPLLALPLLYWAYAFHKRQPKQTNLVFYVHDYLSGQDASAITVAGKEGPSTSILQFGTLLAVDDPVTVGPDPSSEQIGRAQGMYINSQLDGKGLHLVFSVIFTDGEYKGSTLEIQGADIFAMKEREFSVVSGTGYFRFVKGYGIMTTEFMDIPNLRAILKLNFWNFKGIGLTEILMLVPLEQLFGIGGVGRFQLRYAGEARIAVLSRAAHGSGDGDKHDDGDDEDGEASAGLLPECLLLQRVDLAVALEGLDPVHHNNSSCGQCGVNDVVCEILCAYLVWN
ncbi:hypothetical protein RJ639_024776 [Escallonia herrerae]|uniref:Dirigent protein n=1 Tax=Escallonia herrerae TaxID=1293975 RepID=A0AA88RWU4_9ASTE|nr:hypothetical protein RJ639_024776 [Escallonia herrerae]